MLANNEDLGEVELQIEKLRRRYDKPISEATTDRYGRKVLAYPVALDRIGIRAYSLQYIAVKSEDDIEMWSLLTKEEDLLKKHAGYLENVEQL
jgi:ribosomal protein S6